MANQRDPTTPQPPARDEEPTDDIIVHFVLAGLLPSGHVLALHRFQGTLSHLTLVQEQPRMLLEQLFPRDAQRDKLKQSEKKQSESRCCMVKKPRKASAIGVH